MIPTPTPTRTNNPLLHHVLHVYLTPLLIKHRAGQPLIRDDLRSSYRAAQKELPSPPTDPPPPSSSAPPPATAAATASARRNVEWVTNELSNLHALELDAYREAARVALHHTMQSYQLDLPPYLPYNQQNHPSVDDRTNHNSDSSCYVQTCVTHLEQQRFQTLELSWDVEEDIWNDCCINVVRTKAEVAIAAAVAAAAAVRSNANKGTNDATMATVPPQPSQSQPSQSQPSLLGTMEQAAPRSTSYMGGNRSGTNKRGGTVFQEPDKEMVPDGPPIDDAEEEEKGDDEQEEDSSPHQTKDKDPNTNHTTDAAAMPSVPAAVVSVVSVANVPPVAKQHPNKIQTAMGALKKKMNSKGTKKNKLGKVPPASGKSTVRKKKTVTKATTGGHGGPPTTTAPTTPVTASTNHGQQQQQQPPPGKGGGSRGGRGRGGSRRSIGT